MLIKKLILKNIRSYIDEEIKFPEGITLLSGDIGCGKSTILLAIDFALFGIRRGELSGSSLLRNGADEGYVNLNFNINNKEIHIKRTLKKTNLGIVQNSGYLTINDFTQEFTPNELKQKIIELLNYPAESLTKKSLIYRYTVYTPQEEMKLILLGSKEDRLETLRKVFNIDKYKRIKDNSKILITEVKQKKKESQILSSDLEEKINKQKQVENQIKGKTIILDSNKNSLEAINKKITENKEQIIKSEKEVEKLNNLKKDLEVLKNNLISKQEFKLRLNNDINLLEKQILEAQSKTILIQETNFKETIEKNEKDLEVLEKDIRENLNLKINLSTKKQYSEDLKSKVNKIDFCPTCQQNVSQDHKHNIISKEEENIKSLQENINNLLNLEKELSLKINNLKIIIQNLRLQEKEQSINKIRVEDLKQKEERLKNIKLELLQSENIINEILNKKSNLEDELKTSELIESDYKIIKQDLEINLQIQKKNELNLAVINKEIENFNIEINNLKLEIIKKQESKNKLEYYSNLQNWLEEFFINMIDSIEKKVMLKLHSDFNILFQNWFAMLINTELIKVRLDEEFTPLIEQNGHDIEYENLSGGEKTACALAYRLALNQVINTLMSYINTKDLIILDEPTDGFSSDQIDRLRPVSEQLNMKQIIIVSHESKIESFADNIIKIEKRGHISKILS